MKIRCENCYKVLEPQEEYCTFCGTHSDKIAKAMKTGDYGRSLASQFKIDLIIFAVCAFLGYGVSSVIISAVSEDASATLFNRSTSLLISGILCSILMIIVNYKHLKDLFWNGKEKQLFACAGLATLFITIVLLLSLSFDFTQILPSYLTEYLVGGNPKWFSGDATNLSLVIFTQLLIIVTEEIFFRRILIDTLDEETMLSDFWIIVIVAVAGTVLDFAWTMSPETLIVSCLTNAFLAGIYMNTNRSLIFTIIIRILIVVLDIVLFLI